MLKEIGRSSPCQDYSNVQGAAYFRIALLPPFRAWETGIRSTIKQSEWHFWWPADKHHHSNTYNKRLGRTFFKWGHGLHWIFILVGLSDSVCSTDLSGQGSLSYFSWWKSLSAPFFFNTPLPPEDWFCKIYLWTGMCYLSYLEHCNWGKCAGYWNSPLLFLLIKKGHTKCVVWCHQVVKSGMVLFCLLFFKTCTTNMEGYSAVYFTYR